MFANEAGYVTVFAFYRIGTNAGKGVTGIKDTITSKYQKDNGTREVLDVTDIEEEEDGYYKIPYSVVVAGVETRLQFYPESSVENVQVIPWQWESEAKIRATTTESDASTPREWSEAYGPKRVKTPNMEVEQFDPMTILRAQEREAAEPPSFPWHVTIASPNRCKYK